MPDLDTGVSEPETIMRLAHLRGVARIFLGGGLVKFFDRKVCEKKLFNANFVHFSHIFRNLGVGYAPGCGSDKYIECRRMIC